MLPKSVSLLLLIVAIQFSQGFAAPRDGVPDEELSPPTMNADSNPAGGNVDNSKPIVGEAVTDGVSAQPMPVPDETKEPPATNQAEGVATPSEDIPEEHLSHKLTREQELNLMHKVPEFTEIIRAMEELPDEIYEKLKSFLDSTVPKMPKDNLFTQHFKNAGLLIHMFERLVKAARTGAVFKPSNKELFRRVHRAAPAMRREMEQFNGFIANAQPRFASLGTSTNPMNEMAQPLTAGANVAAGSVSLPIEETAGGRVSPAEETAAGSIAAPAEEKVAGSVSAPVDETAAGSVSAPVEEKVGSVSAPVEEKTESFASEFAPPTLTA